MSSYITDARPLLWYVRTFMLTRVCNCFPEVLRRCYCGYAQTLYLRNVNVDYRGTGKMALTFGSISKLAYTMKLKAEVPEPEPKGKNQELKNILLKDMLKIQNIRRVGYKIVTKTYSYKVQPWLS
ncbi:hypothetical protein HanRHA438_Chr11g0519981 [Helianthus annuus]|uniref:Uncharacterized protein n=1 Tax=Helianthus annuus TaxID=4232 RepID=A0A251SD36_HELAN|nr:hypothetical protein HanXRQr2_Chr11g0507471 [Helianthus annuus]KAJ0518685.1 hypothetical protein HanHA89_Chr11g0440221 [Helianthus annuus]KAJ0686727.1 hypothetical protein HanLR1_Chr11g0417981 [Helianthus annuus]KAJ0690529.1 hypothetical protein HanOQP8_Chr11g0418851 [Helianthus annuus]KAJ0872104.1 hypothetical protein HanRHA438_Chr11g0519981 [Helianthus annuus]